MGQERFYSLKTQKGETSPWKSNLVPPLCHTGFSPSLYFLRLLPLTARVSPSLIIGGTSGEGKGTL